MIKFNSQNGSTPLTTKGLAPVWVVLIVLVLVGIVGGGAWYYKFQILNSKNLKNGVEIQEMEFRVYRNELFKFEIQYPKNFSAYEYDFGKEDRKLISFLPYTYEEIRQGLIKDNLTRESIDITIIKNPAKLPPQKLYRQILYRKGRQTSGGYLLDENQFRLAKQYKYQKIFNQPAIILYNSVPSYNAAFLKIVEDLESEARVKPEDLSIKNDYDKAQSVALVLYQIGATDYAIVSRDDLIFQIGATNIDKNTFDKVISTFKSLIPGSSSIEIPENAFKNYSFQSIQFKLPADWELEVATDNIAKAFPVTGQGDLTISYAGNKETAKAVFSNIKMILEQQGSLLSVDSFGDIYILETKSIDPPGIYIDYSTIKYTKIFIQTPKGVYLLDYLAKGYYIDTESHSFYKNLVIDIAKSISSKTEDLESLIKSCADTIMPIKEIVVRLSKTQQKMIPDILEVNFCDNINLVIENEFINTAITFFIDDFGIQIYRIEEKERKINFIANKKGTFNIDYSFASNDIGYIKKFGTLIVK